MFLHSLRLVFAFLIVFSVVPVDLGMAAGDFAAQAKARLQKDRKLQSESHHLAPILFMNGRMEYDQAVLATLVGDRYLTLGMVVQTHLSTLPRSQKEYAVILRPNDDSKQWGLERVEARERIWGTHHGLLVDNGGSNNASQADDKLVLRRSITVKREDFVAIVKAWNAALKTTRRPLDKPAWHNGITYQFYAGFDLNGEIQVPGTGIPYKLVRLGKTLEAMVLAGGAKPETLRQAKRIAREILEDIPQDRCIELRVRARVLGHGALDQALLDACSEVRAAHVKRLTQRLTSSDADDRLDAIRGLALIQDKSVVSVLTQAVRNSDAAVREVAIYGLASIADLEGKRAVFQALKDRDCAVRKVAISALTTWKDANAIVPIVEQLRGVCARQVFIEVYGGVSTFRSDKRLSPLLTNMLSDEKCIVRSMAISALVSSRNKEAILPIIAQLEGKCGSDRYVVNSIKSAVRKLRDAKAFPPLIELLRDNKNSNPLDIIEMLGFLEDVRAVDPLLSELGNRNAKIRKAVYSALGHFRNPKVKQVLLSALGNEEPDVNDAITSSLMSHGYSLKEGRDLERHREKTK